ncbi:hypothetical protein V8C34DRAFT_294143 [Trichoderma compactum]
MMPLPHEPITIHGGCNCGAVRYRINVPSFEQRPLHFVHAPEEASDPTPPRRMMRRMILRDRHMCRLMVYYQVLNLPLGPGFVCFA